MRTRYRASLDGAQLDELHSAVCVTDIVEPPPPMGLITAGRMLGADRLTHWWGRESLRVVIRLCVREREPSLRREICARVARWAQGRELRLSTRPGQRLRVRCDSLAEVSALSWTQELELGFTALPTPWFESETPVTLAVDHTLSYHHKETGQLIIPDQSGELETPGQAATVAEAVVTAVEGGMDWVILRAPQASMAFLSLGMAEGDTLTLDHDPEGRLRAAVTTSAGVSRSVLDRRSMQSADELYLQPGVNTLEVAGDRCLVTFSARGRWM